MTDEPDLTDPNTVHINMLRGTIARPTWPQIQHIYAAEFAEVFRVLKWAQGCVPYPSDCHRAIVAITSVADETGALPDSPGSLTPL